MINNAINRNTFHCAKCNHEWNSLLEHPAVCPKCISRKWDGSPDKRHLNHGSRGKNYSIVPQLRGQMPCASLQDIADKVGLTRERVRQILEKNNKKTKHFKQSYICNNCGKKYTPDYKEFFGINKLFCTKKCRKEYNYKLHHVTVQCTTCGKDKEIKLSQFLYHCERSDKLIFFCDKKCQALWMVGNRKPRKDLRNDI